ncbi:MAG: D-lyxose/D-mannose family sugar isomerase [Spirochaetales bacterium]|nr:D-lyxose/D-mannose family sugar isomerase [Spirochaetales bacterium]
MKRSEINQMLQEARLFFETGSFDLPPWADWSLQEWRETQWDTQAIRSGALGWDMTDFGSGNYQERGLMLFTLRNGNAFEQSKTYAEKIMMVREGQETPMHFHWTKTEDIINRGGGNLILELYNSNQDESLASNDVNVMMDGIPYTIKAGKPITLQPGMSITLETGMYHRFYGEKGRGSVLVGEVSKVNDDASDNRFLETVGRFPSIMEDEEPWRLMVGDYDHFLDLNSEEGLA